jgi:two-component system response regulator PilR (NtrC family)
MERKDDQMKSYESKARVLVAHDEPELAGIILEALVSEGFQVEIAENARRALNLLSDGLHFDLLIANMVMPKLHWLELLRRMYSLGKNLPVIVVRGSATLKTGSQVIGRGPFNYISKTLNVQNLMMLVHRALRQNY